MSINFYLSLSLSLFCSMIPLFDSEEETGDEEDEKDDDRLLAMERRAI